jgi:hypothetical protein
MVHFYSIGIENSNVHMAEEELISISNMYVDKLMPVFLVPSNNIFLSPEVGKIIDYCTYSELTKHSFPFSIY